MTATPFLSSIWLGESRARYNPSQKEIIHLLFRATNTKTHHTTPQIQRPNTLHLHTLSGCPPGVSSNTNKTIPLDWVDARQESLTSTTNQTIPLV